LLVEFGLVFMSASAGLESVAERGSNVVLHSYYERKLDELEGFIREKEDNLRRLEAQRNDLNSKGGFSEGFRFQGLN